MNYKFSTRNFRMEIFLTKCHRFHVAVILRDPFIQLNMWLISSTTRNIILASQTSKKFQERENHHFYPTRYLQFETILHCCFPHPTLNLCQLKASQSQGMILRFQKKKHYSMILKGQRKSITSLNHWMLQRPLDVDIGKNEVQGTGCVDWVPIFKSFHQCITPLPLRSSFQMLQQDWPRF